MKRLTITGLTPNSKAKLFADYDKAVAELKDALMDTSVDNYKMFIDNMVAAYDRLKKYNLVTSYCMSNSR